jgi:uncharacterized protein YukJ
MPITSYGVLKGHPTAWTQSQEKKSAHFHIAVEAEGISYRVAVNTQSRTKFAEQLLFYLDSRFRHPLRDRLTPLAPGFHPLESQPDGLALDYIRSNVVDRRKMLLLPHDLPGEDNDLNDHLRFWIELAIRQEDATLYAYGSRWGPEMRTDPFFGFSESNGLHNVHMNQGSPPRGNHGVDNGVYQDGALLLHLPSRRRWIAIFLTFQLQAWHTDDETGYPLFASQMSSESNNNNKGQRSIPEVAEPDLKVRIIAALVNPLGADFGKETVTLLNTTRETIDLAGWHLANRAKDRARLIGLLEPGVPRTIRLPESVALSNRGDLITLLDPYGMKVDGVAYTARDAEEEDKILVF